jgi:hypothetical protein
VRVHRAVELGEDGGRIKHDYPLRFLFDQVHKKQGLYTKKEILALVKRILLTYGVEILLPVLRKAVEGLLKKLEEDHISPST